MKERRIPRMNDVVEREVLPATREGGAAPVAVEEFAQKLAIMKQQLQLTQAFFKEVMVEGQDYGQIPGTEKPTLLKSGAEKLCEFYNFAPTIKQIDEEKDNETGFYRARVVVALVHKRTGVVVAEGVGEANTKEARYRYRWVPEWKLPPEVDKSALQWQERKDKSGKAYKVYRIENEDLFSLWNTVLKMAKKRALIDATLSATRSSGIFTQDAEDLAEWIEDAPTVLAEAPEPPARPAPPPESKRSLMKAQNGLDWGRIWGLRLPREQVYEEARKFFRVEKVESLKDVISTQDQIEAFRKHLIQVKGASENGAIEI